MKSMSTTRDYVKPFSRTSAMIETFSRAGIRATEGTLRLEVLLGASGQYTFAVNQAQSALASETRLRQGDSFIPTSMGLFVKELTSATATDALQCSANLNTWPSGLFPTGAGKTNLYSIWSTGKLQFQVNSVNVTETIDCMRYYRVGQAQYGLLTVASGTVPTGAYSANSWDSADYGFQTLHQSICLNGQQNNTINLNLGTGADMTTGATGSRYAVLILRGTLLINGAGMVQDSSIKAFTR